MEQHNNITPQEQPTESVSPDISEKEFYPQAQPETGDLIVTSYGVVSRNDVENLIRLNNELGHTKKKSTGKRVLGWFFGIIGGVSFLLICVFLCFAAFRFTIAQKPAANTPDSPSFSYDDDFFHIPDIPDFFFGYGDDVSSSDQPIPDSKTSDAGLGIIVSELNPTISSMYDISGGVVILGLLEPTSFSGTDVREYDIITAAEGSAVTSTAQLTALLNKHQIGDDFTLTITRFTDGFADSFDVTVTLIDKTENQ